MGQGAAGSCANGCFQLGSSGVETTSSSSSAQPIELLELRRCEGLAEPVTLADAKAVVTILSVQSKKTSGGSTEAASLLQGALITGKRRPSLKIVPVYIPVPEAVSTPLSPKQRKSKRLNTSGLAAEYRIRFMNFNMANSSVFSSLSEIQGPGGRGLFDAAMQEPFSDGRAVDIFHTTLVETRLSIGDWVEEYRKRNRNHRLNAMIAQNARREGAQKTGSRMRRVAERIGASYNGNLKSLLAFNTEDFKEDKQAGLFGRLTEAKIGGIPVPNPKKAFMGKVLQAVPNNGCSDPGIRFCFISAHFPMARLAAAMEKEPSDDRSVLDECKICYAKTLRRILYKACARGLIDDKTVLVVQGDLNSRTVLESGEARDVLLEVLNDENMQAALVHELPIAKSSVGQWHEPVEFAACEELPCTYKFSEQGGSGNEGLTLGRILSDADVDEVFRNMSEPPSPPSPRNSRSFFRRRGTTVSLEEKRIAEEKGASQEKKALRRANTAEDQKSVDEDDGRRKRSSVTSAVTSSSEVTSSTVQNRNSTGSFPSTISNDQPAILRSTSSDQPAGVRSTSSDQPALLRSASSASIITRRTNRFSTYGAPSPVVNSIYMRTMNNIGDERLEECGVAFKRETFRPYRFPSSTDRVIYWAPDSLDERLSWRFPQGGYEVNYSQLGSDHRPVALEAVVCVATSLPAPETNGTSAPEDDSKDIFTNGRQVSPGGVRTKRRTSKENFEVALRENPGLSKNLMEIFMEDDMDSDQDPDAEEMSESSPSRTAGCQSIHWNFIAGESVSRGESMTHTVSRGSLTTHESRDSMARPPKTTSPQKRMSAQNEPEKTSKPPPV